MTLNEKISYDNYEYLLNEDVTPSAVHVGNIVQGARLAWAHGRDVGYLDEDSESAKKVCFKNLIVV